MNAWNDFGRAAYGTRTAEPLTTAFAVLGAHITALEQQLQWANQASEQTSQMLRTAERHLAEEKAATERAQAEASRFRAQIVELREAAKGDQS